MSEEQAVYLADELADSPELDEPETRPQRDAAGHLLPGVRLNPYGRGGDPAKRTMVTELRRKADRNASRLAQTAIETALRGNVRALTFIRDTAYGVPAQKLVIQRDDDPMLRWLEAMTGQAIPAAELATLPPPSPAPPAEPSQE